MSKTNFAHPEYYRAERQVYPRHRETLVSQGIAAHLTAQLLEAIGEKPVRFILGRTPRNFDRYNKTLRTIEFNPPAVPLLSIIHEVAHVMKHMEHDDNHATAVALLATILEDLL